MVVYMSNTDIRVWVIYCVPIVSRKHAKVGTRVRDINIGTCLIHKYSVESCLARAGGHCGVLVAIVKSHP